MVENELGDDRERWGTWEELLLGGAVLRHGSLDWDSVASELQSRTLFPSLFTPQVCKAKFEDLQERYSGSCSWFEELRKRRVEELRKVLEKSEDSIGSLETKLNSLKDGKGTCKNADYSSSQTESPLFLKSEGNESSGKEASRDGLSAGSFTQETHLNCSPQSKPDNTKKSREVEEKVPKLGKFPSINKLKDTVRSECEEVKAKRKREVKEKLFPIRSECGLSAGSSSTQETRLNCSSPQCEADNAKIKQEVEEEKGDLRLEKFPSIEKLEETIRSEGGVSIRRRRGKRRRKDLSNNNNNGKEGSVGENNLLGSPPDNVLSPVLNKEAIMMTENEQPYETDDQKPCTSKHDIDGFMKTLDSIMENEHASAFRRRLDSQKRARYKRMIRQHMDLDTIRGRITKRSITSPVELRRDLLLLANNALVFYSKTTREYKCGLALRDLVTKKLHPLHSKPIVNKRAETTPKSVMCKPPAKPRSVRPFHQKFGNSNNKTVNADVYSPSSAESSAAVKKSPEQKGKVGRVKRASAGLQAETPMKVRRRGRVKQ